LNPYQQDGDVGAPKTVDGPVGGFPKRLGGGYKPPYGFFGHYSFDLCISKMKRSCLFLFLTEEA
jgi:hypothetical protein